MNDSSTYFFLNFEFELTNEQATCSTSHESANDLELTAYKCRIAVIDCYGNIGERLETRPKHVVSSVHTDSVLGNSIYLLARINLSIFRYSLSVYFFKMLCKNCIN